MALIKVIEGIIQKRSENGNGNGRVTYSAMDREFIKTSARHLESLTRAVSGFERSHVDHHEVLAAMARQSSETQKLLARIEANQRRGCPMGKGPPAIRLEDL